MSGREIQNFHLLSIASTQIIILLGRGTAATARESKTLLVYKRLSPADGFLHRPSPSSLNRAFDWFLPLRRCCMHTAAAVGISGTALSRTFFFVGGGININSRRGGCPNTTRRPTTSAMTANTAAAAISPNAAGTAPGRRAPATESSARRRALAAAGWRPGRMGGSRWLIF